MKIPLKSSIKLITLILYLLSINCFAVQCPVSALGLCGDDEVCDIATEIADDRYILWADTIHKKWFVREAISRGLSCGVGERKHLQCFVNNKNICGDEELCTEVDLYQKLSQPVTLLEKVTLKAYKIEISNRGISCYADTYTATTSEQELPKKAVQNSGKVMSSFDVKREQKEFSLVNQSGSLVFLLLVFVSFVVLVRKKLFKSKELQKRMRRKAEHQHRSEREEQQRLKREEEQRLEDKEQQRLKREEEQRLKDKEEQRLKRREEQRLKDEEEQRLKSKEEQRLKNKEEQRLKIKEEQRLKREKERRLKREEEQRLQREEEQRLKREEEQRLQRKEEQLLRDKEEKPLKREEERRLKREEERRLKREEEQHFKREQEQRLKFKEEQRIKVEEERHLKRDKEQLLKDKEEQDFGPNSETDLHTKHLKGEERRFLKKIPLFFN